MTGQKQKRKKTGEGSAGATNPFNRKDPKKRFKKKNIHVAAVKPKQTQQVCKLFSNKT